MTIRVSDVSPYGRDAPIHKLTEEDANILRGGPPRSECDFCEGQSVYRRKDREGGEHRACVEHGDDLDRWIRIYNGWETVEAEEGGKVAEGDGSA